jgi:hypothetical protein
MLRTVQDRTGDLHRFVDADLFDDRAGDAKPENGVLGPIFIGMVMRRVVVMVGPITRATRRP